MASPWITQHEVDLVASAVSASWVGPQGPELKTASEALAQRLGGQNVTLVTNGTAALELAFRALGIGPGDEVLVPALTYAATANAVLAVGAQPVFCDVSEETWCLDTNSVKRMLSPRSKAVVVVHLYGFTADLTELLELARVNDLSLVEDCAEALFGTSPSGLAGTGGTVATFSFFANKLITSGEGGAVSTSNKELMDRINLIKGQGMSPDRRYYFEEPGGNFRMSNLQAALLRGQLDRLEEIWSQRCAIEERYEAELSAYMTRPQVTAGSQRSPWLFTARLRQPWVDAKLGLAKHLAEDGIETRPIFYPLPLMPAFAAWRADDIPGSVAVARGGISLPTGAHLTQAHHHKVLTTIMSYLDGRDLSA